MVVVVSSCNAGALFLFFVFLVWLRPRAWARSIAAQIRAKPPCVGDAPGTAATRMPQTQAGTRRQASTSSTSKKQASTGKRKQAAVKFRQSVGRCFALACPVWRGHASAAGFGRIIGQSAPAWVVGLELWTLLAGGDASIAQWLKRRSSDFIEARWAGWTPPRLLRERTRE